MWAESYDLSNNTCFIFNNTIATVAKIRLGTAVIGALVCILAAIVIMTIKLYRKFTHRLYLYLTIANIGYTLTFILQYLAVNYETKTVFQTPCMMAGFLMQYTGWIVLNFTAIITIHLGCLIIAHKNYKSKKVEAFYILFGFGFPILFSWIPFINQTYGLTSDWCWIRWTNYMENTTVQCPLNLDGVIESIVLWNGPMIILVVVSFIAVVAMIGLLIKRSIKYTTYSDMQQRHKALLKEALPFLIYPIAFYLICAMEMVNHIHYAVNFPNASFGLWVVNAMCAPLRAVPIILVLLYPGVLVNGKKSNDLAKTLKQTGQCASNETSFFAGSENTSQDKLTSFSNKLVNYSYSSVAYSELTGSA